MLTIARNENVSKYQTSNMSDDKLVPVELIARKIFIVRGQKVMLDSDLAELYDVETKILNKAVARNKDRFPEDFMFRLTAEESESLRFQNGTSKIGRGGRRYLPFVLTEQGVAMLSSVLRSKKALQVNIAIMRTFVELRRYLATQKDVKIVLTEHQRMLEKHDKQIHSIFEVIQQLTKPEEKPKRRFGFVVEEPIAKYRVKQKRE